ncbi:NADH-quinone oxidoreductase subunit M [Solicola gregarius]|uniref:NADH-quinone oxidoreductase subunit M n=1 Tax=Solicola gregarius TaxID=2908642 RepID=A0AA46YJK6_9ACTN|nr:NADH-quinone oxidoreductase subunit M [Solicola gregarius]UYM03689.1 NADH-quinone oxidoreductase subunit M [Solicola gregarius]
MSFPWLTVLAALPIVGALVLVALPRGRTALVKQTAIGFTLVTLVLAIAMATQYSPDDGGYQLTEQHEWISVFGAYYALGVNGIGLTLILMTVILTPIVVLASWKDGDTGRWSPNAFFAWMLALEGLAIGVFAAMDVFLFYVLFEATLIPIYFLIGGFGGVKRSYAAIKFLLFSLVGGLLMLASVVGLYVVSAEEGDPSYLITDLMNVDMSETTGRWLFLGFMIAFAIKAPMWPLHTWLPDAAAAGTPGTSVLLVSILDKIGTFGMIRFCLGLFPEASDWASPVVIVLALISIIYGALLAIGQDDIRRLIAYTSVSHFGFIVLGIFVLTSQSASGAALYMFNHGLSTAALFLVTGIMISRRGSARISDFGGVQKIAPLLAGVFLIAGLSSLSLPGLSPFVSEFLVLAGTFTHSIAAAVVATLGIVLAALYILLMYQRTMTGPLRDDNAGVTDLRPRELAALAPAVVLIIGLGFFPQPLLDVINPAVSDTLEHVGVHDPEPDHPAATSAEEAQQ